jgi:molecular chaperone GrpE
MSDDHTPAEEMDAVAEATLDHMEKLTAENAGLKEQVLRYAAEAENIRRRAEREANDARAYAIQKFARDLLTVADTLGRALSAPPEADDAAVKGFVVGVEMTAKALQTAFETNGLKRIEPAKGTKFDPHQHQAMMEQPSTEVGAGAVIQTLQPGYELLGRRGGHQGLRARLAPGAPRHRAAVSTFERGDRRGFTEVAKGSAPLRTPCLLRDLRDNG